MQIVHDLESLRRSLAPERDVALVPTMGNLHEGHLSLVRIAASRARRVVVSIFVNRLQFAPSEDFERYPRTFEADCAKLAAEGAAVVFAPDEGVLYPEPQVFLVEPPAIANELEGKFRPRFFHGVATVVLKLFSCVQPRVAVFGKKDYQQWRVVRAMCRQFSLPTEIIACETTREPDGLAMSSRNRYLDAAERAEAPRLYRELCALRDRIRAGARDFPALEARAANALAAAGWQPEYVAIRRQADLKQPDDEEAPLVALAAARLGTTRLIDNVEI